MVQADRSLTQLFTDCIRLLGLLLSIQKLAIVCCEQSAANFQNPSSLPSSTCIDMLRGLFHVWCMCISSSMCSCACSATAAAVCASVLSLQQQRQYVHLYLLCNSSSRSVSAKIKYMNIAISITMPISQELSWHKCHLLLVSGILKMFRKSSALYMNFLFIYLFFNKNVFILISWLDFDSLCHILIIMFILGIPSHITLQIIQGGF